MADQRGGGVRKKESLNLTDTDEETVHGLLADQDGRIKESAQHSASRRIRSQQRVSEAFAILEFGRDTNRLDYFKVTALDLHGDDHLAGVSTHGGGTRDRGVVVGRSMEQEGGSDTDTAVAYGGIRIRRGPVRFSTNNGSESVVQRLERERGNGGGGGRGSCMVEGPRSVEERGGVTAGSRWCWWWSGGPKIKAGRGNCSYAGGGGCGNGGDDGGCHGGVRDGDDEDRR